MTLDVIDKTDAVVLRVAPFSRTSHMVTWFTLQHGKVVTVVKGAERTKSAFLGQYDLFYTCELLYYAREKNGVHVARECCPVNTRERFRKDWRAAGAASYACDLVARNCHDEHRQPELFDLLSAFLDFIAAHGGKREVVFWFELAFAGTMGFAPHLSECAVCGGRVNDIGQANISSRRGGLICGNCASSATEGEMERLAPDILAILRTWQATESPRAAHNTICNKAQAHEMQRLLGNFLHYHLDILPPSRYIALKLLADSGTKYC